MKVKQRVSEPYRTGYAGHIRQERLERFDALNTVSEPVTQLSDALALAIRELDQVVEEGATGAIRENARAFVLQCLGLRDGLYELAKGRDAYGEAIRSSPDNVVAHFNFFHLEKQDRAMLKTLRAFERDLVTEPHISNDTRATLLKGVDDLYLTLAPASLERGYR